MISNLNIHTRDLISSHRNLNTHTRELIPSHRNLNTHTRELISSHLLFRATTFLSTSVASPQHHLPSRPPSSSDPLPTSRLTAFAAPSLPLPLPLPPRAPLPPAPAVNTGVVPNQFTHTKRVAETCASPSCSRSTSSALPTYFNLTVKLPECPHIKHRFQSTVTAFSGLPNFC